MKRSKAWSGRLAVSMVRNSGNGQRVYRKRVIGTVEQYSDAVEARRFAAGILAMPSPADLPTKPVAMTIAELGQHFSIVNWHAMTTGEVIPRGGITNSICESGSFRDGETMHSVRCERSKSNPGCEACP